jgi:acetyl esterase/lipase
MTSAAASSAAQSSLNPDLFKPQAIDQETLAWNAQLATLLATVPPIWSQPVELTRARREEGGGPFGQLVMSEMAVNRTITVPNGPLKVRTFVPPTVTGVYLHFHGGGWTLGGAHHNDPLLELIARRAQVAVVSVEYRLAPEHPYPAGPDDCEAAALWLVEHASAEFGSDRLLIGGESAGAHLSVVTLVRLRDKHGFSGFSRANLTFGAYDLTSTPSVAQAPSDTLVLTREAISWFLDQFVPDAATRKLADVSPLWADLHGLPSALFTVGTLDPLVDDSLFMHGRWIAAGNQGELAIYPGAVHGFNGFPYGLARRANERIVEFLGQT